MNRHLRFAGLLETLDKRGDLLFWRQRAGGDDVAGDWSEVFDLPFSNHDVPFDHGFAQPEVEQAPCREHAGDVEAAAEGRAEVVEVVGERRYDGQFAPAVSLDDDAHRLRERNGAIENVLKFAFHDLFLSPLPRNIEPILVEVPAHMLHLKTLFVNLHDQIDHLRRLHDVKNGVHVLALEQMARQHLGFEPEEQARPDFAEEDDRRFAEMLHLHELPGIKKFEQRADAAGRDDHRVGNGHEGVEAATEPVELLLDVEIGVGMLLMRQFDVQPDRLPAVEHTLRPGIGRLHQPRPAAGHDVQSLSSQPASDFINIAILLIPLTDPGRPENGYTIMRVHE